MHALVTCHLAYYCNTLLHDVSQYQQQRLQRVLNAAARLICRLPKYYHISPVLKDLHWLPIKYPVIFKITLLVFKVLHGLAPSYVENLIRVKPKGRYHLRKKDQLLVQIFKSGPVLWKRLPVNIREISNIQKVKQELKTFLFRLAYQ